MIWQEWFNAQWNRPDRADYYIMQVAYMLSKGNVTLDKFKIPFKDAVDSNPMANMSPAEEEEYKRRISKQLLANRLASLGASEQQVDKEVNSRY